MGCVPECVKVERVERVERRQSYVFVLFLMFQTVEFGNQFFEAISV